MTWLCVVLRVAYAEEEGFVFVSVSPSLSFFSDDECRSLNVGALIVKKDSVDGKKVRIGL